MSRSYLVLVCLTSVFSATKLHGQDLPQHAIARLGDYRFHHGSSIKLVAISPNGLEVASLARKPSYYRHISDKDREPFDRTIVLWDAISGRRIRDLQAPSTPVLSLTFSPDGKRLLVVSGRANSKSHFAFFDVGSGEIVDQFGEFKDDSPWNPGPQLIAEGKQLLICAGCDTVLSLDINSRKVQKQWQAPASNSEWIKQDETVTRAVPSPDGRFIAWHVDVLPDYSKVPPGVIVPPWVPDPSIVLMTDATTNKVLYRKDFGIPNLGSFVFSADGGYFMTCDRQKVTAWKTATGTELFTLADPSPYGVALSPDGRWALVSSGYWRCRLWSLSTKTLMHEFHGAIGHNYLSPRSQLFSVDGKSVVTWTDATLRVFDAATGKGRSEPGHRGGGIMVRFAENGRQLFGACKETRTTWELAPGKKPTMLTFAPRKAWETGGNRIGDQCNDCRFFVDEQGGRVRIRDTSTGQVIHELDKDDWWGTFARFSPDGRRLALRRYFMERGIDKQGNHYITTSNEPERLRLYDTQTGQKTGEIQLKNGLSWVVPAFSPGGLTIAWVDRHNDVHLHDAIAGKPIQILKSTKPLPKKECGDADLLFSPDGRRLIVTTYLHELLADPNDELKWNTLPTRVFDVTTGREIIRFYANPEKTRSAAGFTCVACSPDGRSLAVAEQESAVIRVIEIATGKVRAQFEGHRDGVRDLAFSPDSRMLASGGEDNVIYLWDLVGSGVN